MSAMPAQKPGRSVQEVCTPPEFIAAACHKLRIPQFAIDLAADESNTVAEHWFDEQQNSLIQPWSLYTSEPGLWGWLNMPFGKIEPWVQKCYQEARKGAKTAALVPAAVGSNWWRDWVHRKASVLLLNGRITFVGHPTCYPKDCCLLLYETNRICAYDVWTWPEEIP